MAPLQRLVIAVLKPYEPTTHAFTQQVATAVTVTSVNATFVELDKDVLNLRLTSEGTRLSTTRSRRVSKVRAGRSIQSIRSFVESTSSKIRRHHRTDGTKPDSNSDFGSSYQVNCPISETILDDESADESVRPGQRKRSASLSSIRPLELSATFTPAI